MATIDISSPRELTRVVEEQKAPKTFLTDMFFGTEVTHDTENIDLDYVARNRNEPVYVSPIQDGIVLTRAGFARSTFQAPYLKLIRPLTVRDTFVTLPGEKLYSDMSPDERKAYLAGQDARQLQEEVIRAKEIQAATVLTTGKLTIYRSVDGQASPVAVEQVDFVPTAVRSTNFRTLSGTDLWDNASVNILEQLRTESNLVASGSGIRPDLLLMGSSLVPYFINDTKIQALLDLRRAEFGIIDPKVYDNRAYYVGDLRYPGISLEIWGYDETYTNVSGVSTPMIPVKNYLMGSRNGGVTEMHYGAIQNLKARNAMGSSTGYIGRYFTHTWMKPDGSAEYMQMESAPCAAMLQPRAFVCNQALA